MSDLFQEMVSFIFNWIRHLYIDIDSLCKILFVIGIIRFTSLPKMKWWQEDITNLLLDFSTHNKTLALKYVAPRKYNPCITIFIYISIKHLHCFQFSITLNDNGIDNPILFQNFKTFHIYFTLKFHHWFLFNHF